MTQTAELLKSSHTSVRDWCRQYAHFAEAGLALKPRGRLAETITDSLCAKLLELPDTYNYLRSRWTSEMLAEQLYETLEVFIHAFTVRRLLLR